MPSTRFACFRPCPSSPLPDSVAAACPALADAEPMRLPRLAFLVSDGAIAHHGWFDPSEFKASLGKVPTAES
jgi:hypothetical protein